MERPNQLTQKSLNFDWSIFHFGALVSKGPTAHIIEIKKWFSLRDQLELQNPTMQWSNSIPVTCGKVVRVPSPLIFPSTVASWPGINPNHTIYKCRWPLLLDSLKLPFLLCVSLDGPRCWLNIGTVMLRMPLLWCISLLNERLFGD